MVALGEDRGSGVQVLARLLFKFQRHLAGCVVSARREAHMGETLVAQSFLSGSYLETHETNLLYPSEIEKKTSDSATERC